MALVHTRTVLCELRVENLLLIERAELRLAPGLNALTGETGAGKTVLAHALDLFLGGRARPAIVRPGAPEAYVEGIFDEDGRDVVLARRVTADGRTRASIDHRSCTVGELGERAVGLLRFYGQHEHRKLTLASAQLEVLDAYCGAEHLARRRRCAQGHDAVRAAQAALDDLRERTSPGARELELLAHELGEIEDAALSEAERDELASRRARLRNVELLRTAAQGAAEALSPADGQDGAATLAGAATAALAPADGLDPALDALAVRVRSLAYEAADLASDLRGHAETIDADPGELDAVEARLAVYERLERKHGATVAAVLAHGERCRAELAGAESADEALDAAAAALRAAEARRAELAAALRATREAAAPKLARAVRKRLAGLAMDGAAFDVVLGQREPGPAGADAVEFRIAPNAGVPAGPLREIASGGELSRVMLALMGVADASAPPRGTGTVDGGSGGRATLIFDEVDAGIGGQTARVVGERLRELAAGRQVVCITHLPQVASLAARHFSIAKDGRARPARTTVAELSGDAVVSELVRMLGADEADAAARRHAEELVRAA